MEKQIKREGREVSRKEARAKESEEWNVIASCSVMQCAVVYYIVAWFDASV